MTDLEICKRIADIEHGSCFIDGDDTGNFINLNHPMSDRGGEAYNPLTDKALCFDLMVKHKIEVGFDDDGECMTAFYFRKSEVHISPVCEGDKNPQRAICLAIIKKHEVESND